MLHHRAQDGGLEMLPIAVALGDGDEIAAEENAADFRDLEQRPARGERPADLGAGEIGHRAGTHDVAAGEEFQGGGIGRGFGLDEHGDKPYWRQAFWNRSKSDPTWTCSRPRSSPTKSEAIPFFSQSPKRVGSGPFGPPSSGGRRACVAAVRRRSSASASARSPASRMRRATSLSEPVSGLDTRGLRLDGLGLQLTSPLALPVEHAIRPPPRTMDA